MSWSDVVLILAAFAWVVSIFASYESGYRNGHLDARKGIPPRKGLLDDAD